MAAGYRALAAEVPDGLVWFWIGAHDEYEQLLGKCVIARDPGSSVVHVRVEVAAPVVPKVEAAITIFRSFEIKPDASPRSWT